MSWFFLLLVHSMKCKYGVGGREGDGEERRELSVILVRSMKCKCGVGGRVVGRRGGN